MAIGVEIHVISATIVTMTATLLGEAASRVTVPGLSVVLVEEDALAERGRSEGSSPRGAGMIQETSPRLGLSQNQRKDSPAGEIPPIVLRSVLLR